MRVGGLVQCFVFLFWLGLGYVLDLGFVIWLMSGYVFGFGFVY